VVAIIGNVKNAGKTTVLNYCLQNLSQDINGITSIGLDGEAIDQVTYLPKPRIFVTTGSLVATAKQCLAACEAEYDLVKETKISTALGPIILIRITKPGNCLVAGPATIKEMETIIRLMGDMKANRVLIDGAFSRQSPAVLADATILCVGADRHPDMATVIRDATLKIRQLSLAQAGKDMWNLSQEDTLVALMKDGSRMVFPEKSTLLDPETIIDKITPEMQALYCPRALGTRFLRQLIQAKKRDINLIIKSPVHLQLDDRMLNHMDLWARQITVLHPIRVVAVCINPTSPKGYAFPKEEFKSAMQATIDIPVYNVLDEQGANE
jgi:hypothetical protein